MTGAAARTYLLRAAEQAAEREAAARDSFPAVLPLLEVLALHFRLLLRVLDGNILPCVRLEDRSYIWRLKDRDRYRTVSFLAKGRRV